MSKLQAIKDRAKQLGIAKPDMSATTSHPKGKRAKGGQIATPEEMNATTTRKQRGVASMSPSEVKTEVSDLLKQLADATDVQDKKRIRRALRLRGHRGGLGKRSNVATPAK